MTEKYVKLIKNPFFILGLMTIILSILPKFLNSTLMTISITTLWMMFLCSAWNICGIGGIFALSHGVALACGAYSSTYLWVAFKVSPLVGMIAGGAFVALVGLLISYLGFRRGMTMINFCLFTIIWGFIGEFVIGTSFSFLGSSDSIANPYSGTHPFLFQFENPIFFYYIILGFNIGAILLCRYVITSKFGVYLRAIHGNERFAEAAGVNTMACKTLAVVISMVLWSFAGSFWAQYTRVAAADLASLVALMFAVLIVVLGGMGTLWGPVLGAIVLVPIREVLRIKFVTLPGLSLVIYGIIILVILRTLRSGVFTWVGEHLERKRVTKLELARKEKSAREILKVDSSVI